MALSARGKRRFIWFLGGLACLMLWFWLYGMSAAEIQSWKADIETLNGATWPDSWNAKGGTYDQHRGTFMVLIVIRSVLNVGAPIAGLAAAFYLLFFLEKRMKMSIDEVLEVRDAELLSAAFIAFEQRTQRKLSTADRDYITERARSVRSGWLKKTEIVPRKDDQES